jgi:alpha-D-ribose 1-methylphosphonate 5-triphosphate diphosphatase
MRNDMTDRTQAPVLAPVQAPVLTTVLTNARIVLADRVIERGWLAMADGVIAEFGEGRPPERGDDLQGDLLMPGLVELHTDHLEAHYSPRPKVHWDPVAAVVSFDGQLATSGITTVLDSLRVWSEDGAEEVDGEAETLANAIGTARDSGMLRTDHYLHLRCEVPMPNVVEEAAALIGRNDVRLVSLMDHTPGQRQFRDESKLRDYYRRKKGGLTDAQMDELFRKRHEYQADYFVDNYRRLVELAQVHGTPLASHDDTTLEHVSDAVRDHVAIAEFPTTVEAAHALHQAGVRVLMGAPNLVRGGSHAGNVATSELAEAGVLDVLSSDYMPASLLMAALRLPDAVPGFGLAAAVRTVTKTPAEAVGLGDRGEILAGKRADLIRVHVAGGVPFVRTAWRGGNRVA